MTGKSTMTGKMERMKPPGLKQRVRAVLCLVSLDKSRKHT